MKCIILGFFCHLDDHLMQTLNLWDTKATVVVSIHAKQMVLRYFYTLCSHLKELKGLMDFQGSWIKQTKRKYDSWKVYKKGIFSEQQVLSTEFISWLYSARELQRTWISCSLWHEISFTKRKYTPPYHFSDTERLPSFILMFRWAIPQWIKHFTQDSCMQRYTDVQSKMLKIAIKPWE